jgi:hypothetical protein
MTHSMIESSFCVGESTKIVYKHTRIRYAITSLRKINFGDEKTPAISKPF